MSCKRFSEPTAGQISLRSWEFQSLIASSHLQGRRGRRRCCFGTSSCMPVCSSPAVPLQLTSQWRGWGRNQYQSAPQLLSFHCLALLDESRDQRKKKEKLGLSIRVPFEHWGSVVSWEICHTCSSSSSLLIKRRSGTIHPPTPQPQN